MLISEVRLNLINLLSTVIGKAGLELLAGVEDTALDSSQGQIHLFSDFVVFVTLNVHREGDAIVVLHLVDGVGDFVCSESVFGSLER